MIIAVDAMGGDHAPHEIVKGCIAAQKELDVEIFLVGDKDTIEKEIKKYNGDLNKIHIKHCTEIVNNHDKPVQAIRQKKDSSMVVGLNMLKRQEVDAFISAGNTGALLAGSLFQIGRIKGIDRPAIAVPYPTRKGISLLVDAGANAECKAKNLLEFAMMGKIYAEKVLNVEETRVGLVNIGSEEGKGTEIVKKAYELLNNSELNFIGNIEARELPNGAADIIVCDGFVGNVILKLTEGVAITIMTMLKNALEKNLLSKLGALLLMPTLRKFKKELDYTEYGGALLLGVNGAVIKAHGSSNAKAVKNAIVQAEKFVEQQIIQSIHTEMMRIGDEKDGN
ncbi:MAG: phosphate acyltransferase PlsX [Thermotaleaceae bacterium]